MQKPVFYFIACLVLAGGMISCSVQKKHQKAPRPLPVIVGEAISQDVPVYIEAIGNAAAFNSVDIRPQVSGKIIDIRIHGGDDVQVGDLLYRIDPIPYKLALEKAKANLLKNEAELEYARRKVERYETLIKGDYVSKLSIEEYKRDVSTLEAQILIDKSEIGVAQTNLNYCNIFSPIDGRVSLQKIEIGNVVSPTDSNPMTTILQIAPIYINFSIAQREFEELQHVLAEGKRSFQVILPGSQQQFDGEVVAVNNQVDVRTGTIQIKGLVRNREKILWPGEFVRVRVFIRTKQNAVLVPDVAVQVGQDGSYVYVLKQDGTVENVAVKIGEHVDKLVVVDEGLEAGATIITDGQINLRPGAKVLVTNPASKKESEKEEKSDNQKKEGSGT